MEKLYCKFHLAENPLFLPNGCPSLFVQKTIKTKRSSGRKEPASKIKSIVGSGFLPTITGHTHYCRTVNQLQSVSEEEENLFIRERTNEHNRELRLVRTQTRAVPEHANETRHYPLWNKVMIFDGDPLLRG